MSNILAIAINSQFTHSSLALRYFREYAKCDIFECSINDDIFNIFSQLSQKKYKAFCFSVYIWNVEYTLKLASMLKDTCPEIKVIFGGPEAGYNYKNLLEKYSFVDAIMRGEGELAMKALEDGISPVPNLAYKKDGKIVENEFVFTDLSKLEFPYKESDLEQLQNKIIYFEASRGCLYNCTYCLSSSQGKTRFFTSEYVKKGLAFFIENNIPLVKFVDRTFNENNEKACEIARFIVENSKITHFHFEIAPQLLTDEFLEICSKSNGKIQFEMGIQTTNRQTMKAIHRIYDTEKTAEKILKIPKCIHTHIDLIAGLPYETVETFKDGFNYVFSLKPSMLQLGFLKLLHNTKLKEEADSYKIKTTNFPPYEVLETSTMSKDELITLKNTEKAVDRIYNSGAFQNTLKALECDNMFDIFYNIGQKLSKTEQKSPVSRTGLYEFIYNIYGNKIKKALAVDFLQSNLKAALPDFLNEPINNLKELYKKVSLIPEYSDKKIRIVKSCNCYFVTCDGITKEINL